MVTSKREQIFYKFLKILIFDMTKLVRIKKVREVKCDLDGAQFRWQSQRNIPKLAVSRPDDY
jgi:hypothetical protein